MNIKKITGIAHIKHSKRKSPDKIAIDHLDDKNHRWLAEGIIQLT